MSNARIIKALENSTDRSLFDIWNNYCEDVGYYDDKVEFTDDVIEYTSKEDLIVIAKNCDNVDFSDTFFVYGVYYWQYQTSDNVIDLISIDELADYIENKPDFAETCELEIDEDGDEDEDEDEDE